MANGKNGTGPKYRFTSVRQARRLLEQVILQAYHGHRPVQEVPPMAAGIKALTELMLVEKMLTSKGLDFEDPNHPMGVDGEAGQPEQLPARRFVEHTERVVSKPVVDVDSGALATVTSETVTGGPGEVISDPMARGVARSRLPPS